MDEIAFKLRASETPMVRHSIPGELVVHTTPYTSSTDWVSSTAQWTAPSTGSFGYLSVNPITTTAGSSDFSAYGHIDSVCVTCVAPLPTVTFNPVASRCVNGGQVDLAAIVTPGGGVFSGTGIDGSTFSPLQAGPGTHTITYTYTDEYGCRNCATQLITVFPRPEVSFNPVGPFCPGDQAVDLMVQVTPTGGTFWGDGVDGSVFNPAIAGPGTHTITYTYTDANGCVGNAQAVVVVDAQPSIVFDSLGRFICLDDDAIDLRNYVDPDGGAFDGPGVTGYTFDPGLAGVGLHSITYTYTDPSSGCIGVVERPAFIEECCMKVPTNSVLWLPFDESNGRYCTNLSGGNIGKCGYDKLNVVDPPFVRPVVDGYVGRSLSFDGSYQSVSVGSYEAINFNNRSFSIDAWVRRSPGSSGVRTIVEKMDYSMGNLRGYSLYLKDGELRLQLADNSPSGGSGEKSTTVASSLTVPDDDGWHFIAVTVSMEAVYEVWFYVDWESKVLNLSEGVRRDLGTTAALYVGRSGKMAGSSGGSASGSNYFKGGIDEVEIFDQALSSLYIDTLRMVESHGKCKGSCPLPPFTELKSVQNPLVVDAEICNANPTSETYQISFREEGGDGCGMQMSLPPDIILTIGPNECQDIPSTLSYLSGSGFFCYSMTVNGSTYGEEYTCLSRVSYSRLLQLDSPPVDHSAIWKGGGIVVGPYPVLNPDTVTHDIDFTVSAVDEDLLIDSTVIRINGLAPGIPWIGHLTLSPGATVNLDSVSVEYSEYDPLRRYFLILQCRVDADSALYPIVLASLRNVIPPSTDSGTCVEPVEGIRAWWGGEGGVSDYSGNGNDGSFNGGMSVTNGLVDEAFSFDGSNDYIEIPPDSTLNVGVSDFSIEAWIRTGVNTGIATILEKRVQSPYRGYSFHLYNGGPSLQLADAVNGEYTNYNSNTSIADGEWHHVAATVDRDDSTGLSFYIDGVVVSAQNPTGRPGALDNASVARIGSRTISIGGLFTGSLDELTLIGRALTAIEVSAIYSAGVQGKCKAACPPVPTSVAVHLRKGWNLVTVPTSTRGAHRAELFPGSVGSAFSFDQGYIAVDTIRNGIGYWLKMTAETTVVISGTANCVSVAQLKQGWNIIGSLSDSVPTNRIQAYYGDLLNSHFYSYSQGYQIASAIEPGRGYWVKSTADAQMVLQNVETLKKIPPTGQADLSDFNSLSVVDASGAGQDLYFGYAPPGSINQAHFEMPPPPPPGIFDARFETGRNIELSGDVGARLIPLVLSSVNWPLALSWDVGRARGADGVLHVGRDRVPLRWDGTMSIDKSDRDVVLELLPHDQAQLPVQFSLRQNYPNPFNPETRIAFDIPSEVVVTLAIYDILGRQVTRVLDRVQYQAGSYEVHFNAGQLASGTYLYRISAVTAATTFVQVKKMLLLR